MTDTENAAEDPVEIPCELLSNDVLKGVIDDFILRYGTDYGATEVSYETHIEQVRRQIKSGHVKIYFDPKSETVTLLPK